MKQLNHTGLVVAVGITLAVSGCNTVNSIQQRLANGSTMTEEEYNARLPDDVHPDSRGRLPIVNRSDLDDEGKAIYDRYMSPESTSLAGIQGPGGLRLHARADRSPSKVDSRIRELVRLVIAREMDHQFEWTLHEPVALRAGLSADTIDVIRYNRSLQGVPEQDAAVIRMGREIFREHRVSPETYTQLSRHFGRKDLIEIAELMGGGMNSFILLFLFDVHLPYDREPLLPVN